MKNNVTEPKEYIAMCKKHKLCFITWIIIMILTGFIIYSGKLMDAIPILLIVELVGTIKSIIEYKTTYIACTNTMLVGHIGFINSKTLSTPLIKVQSVGMSNGLFGKIFGYHTVTICNAGTSQAEYVFTTMSNAKQFVDKVNELIVSNSR